MQYLIIITQNTAFFICQFLIILSHNCKLTICKSLKFPKGVHEPKTKTKQTPSNMGSPAPATLMLKQSWGFSWLSDYSPLPSCLPRSSFIYTLGLRTARGVCSPVTLSACWPVGREVCGRHQRAGRCAVGISGQGGVWAVYPHRLVSAVSAPVLWGLLEDAYCWS